MKRVLTISLLVFGLIFASSYIANTPSAHAQDVWVVQRTAGDIYVVTETIDSDGSTYVNVTTKTVKNGRLVNIDECMYGYVEDHQMWWMNTKSGRKNNQRAIRIWDGEKDPVLGFCLNYVRK